MKIVHKSEVLLTHTDSEQVLCQSAVHVSSDSYNGYCLVESGRLSYCPLKEFRSKLG